MIIDALDLLHERSVDVFVLVSSDSDFTALATRIREEGITVIGVGRKTTPSSFVKGVDQFLLMESMVTLPTQEPERLRQPQEPTIEVEPQSTLEVGTEGKDLLTRAAKQAADADG